MIRTLYGKLVAVLLAFTLIMAILFLVAIRHSDLARTQENNQALYRSLAARTLAPETEPKDGLVDAAAVARVEERIQFINPRIEAYLLDAAGKVIAAPGQPDAVGRSVSLGPLQRLMANDDAQLPILGDDPAFGEQKRVFSVAGVQLGDGSDGYLYLVIRGRSGDTLAERVANSNVLKEILVLMACGLLMTLAAAALIVQIITRPVRRLAVFVDRFRRSGFAEQPDPARIAGVPRDEIGQLAETFNHMAERMLNQMEAMKQADATRRELIANISHDLRTPLASLQGYIETLQVREAVLTPAEKEAYLQTALRHTEQLSQLVAKLFELAKLDSEQASLFPEPFVLEDLIQDVIQEFELAIRQKGVSLETRTPVEVPLVFGDIGLIERVLRNLLENALRFTEAGGTIGVAVLARPDACRVEVWDTGAGIEPADLPRIFDRFYRGQKSRGDAAAHAGLGLAIVKRIVDLHGGTIEASSRPGMTVFSFTLAYAGRGADVIPIARARSAA
jgi:two-component system OmpR family sensor kinase